MKESIYTLAIRCCISEDEEVITFTTSTIGG